MIFTDQDLSSLKKRCGDLDGLHAFRADFILSLVARLEAAETALELNYSSGAPGFEDTIAYETWREKAGK